MNTKEFLQYQIALLTAKYGRAAVLQSFADVMRLSESDIERLLARVQTLPTDYATVRRKSSDPFEDEAAKQPLKATALRALGVGFRDRLFLPELRDVRRFFERHDRSIGSAKSRAATEPRLATLLGALNLDELESLAHEAGREQQSSLGIISDEILRRDE